MRERSPNSNIYFGIDRKLLSNLDPVLKKAIERVTKAYQETFWAIPNASDFSQACQALARRGLNVNCITLYWGPGGVGLSRYSAHLEAMYREQNYCTFDPNVFYEDGELRKQIVKMAGKVRVSWRPYISYPTRSRLLSLFHVPFLMPSSVLAHVYSMFVLSLLSASNPCSCITCYMRGHLHWAGKAH